MAVVVALLMTAPTRSPSPTVPVSGGTPRYRSFARSQQPGGGAERRKPKLLACALGGFLGSRVEAVTVGLGPVRKATR